MVKVEPPQPGAVNLPRRGVRQALCEPLILMHLKQTVMMPSIFMRLGARGVLLITVAIVRGDAAGVPQGWRAGLAWRPRPQRERCATKVRVQPGPRQAG